MMYVIISACVYAWGCLGLVGSWYAVFLFIIPLMYQKFPDSYVVRFGYGMVWGSIVFGLLWSWLPVMLSVLTTSYGAYGLYLLATFWCSLLSGLWLILFPEYPVLATVSFFFILHKYWMFVAGVVEGYPLASPLILLAQYPWTLGGLYWVGDIGMLLGLIGLQVQLCRGKYVILICLGVYLLGAWVSNSEPCHVPPKNFKVLCPWWYQKGDAMYSGYRMAHDLTSMTEKDATTRCIVLPESSFCFDLCQYHEFISIWTESVGDAYILLGSHVIKNNKAHNCTLLLHNGEIVQRYDKQHLMPLMERPLFGDKNIRSQAVDDDIVVIDGTLYQIFICSELFFESKAVRGVPIILLWNDSWLQWDWVKNLALYFINYFEQKYHVTVWHVSTQGRTNWIST